MIPEAAVEAAARAIYPHTRHTFEDTYEHIRQRCREQARTALEAAAPHIAAKALEDAADAFESLPANKGAEISTGTWDWFELFPITHLRNRAEDLRK